MEGSEEVGTSRTGRARGELGVSGVAVLTACEEIPAVRLRPAAGAAGFRKLCAPRSSKAEGPLQPPALPGPAGMLSFPGAGRRGRIGPGGEPRREAHLELPCGGAHAGGGVSGVRRDGSPG